MVVFVFSSSEMVLAPSASISVALISVFVKVTNISVCVLVHVLCVHPRLMFVIVLFSFRP